MEGAKAPEVVMPQIYEFVSEPTQSTFTPDLEYTRDLSIDEATILQDPKDRRGENVW